MTRVLVFICFASIFAGCDATGRIARSEHYRYHHLSWWITNATDTVLKFRYPTLDYKDRPCYMVDSIYPDRPLRTQGKQLTVLFSTQYTARKSSRDDKVNYLRDRRRIRVAMHEKEGPLFLSYFDLIAQKHGKDVCWQILSEDGVVLKIWRYSDKGAENRRFFDETQWSVDEILWSPPPNSDIWTFIIRHEDVVIE